MNVKNKKENAQKSGIQRKQGKALKEFVPPSKNAIREMNFFKAPTEINRTFKIEFEPVELFPEWPGDEEAKNFDFSLVDHSSDDSYLITQENIFYDVKNDDINLPNSIVYFSQQQIKWLRPEQYIREYLVDKEIKHRYSNRNNIKLRKRIRETHQQMSMFDKSIINPVTGEMEENQFAINAASLKKSAKKASSLELTLEEQRFRQSNKEIFKYYDMPLDIKVVNYLDIDIDKDRDITNNTGMTNVNNKKEPNVNIINNSDVNLSINSNNNVAKPNKNSVNISSNLNNNANHITNQKNKKNEPNAGNNTNSNNNIHSNNSGPFNTNSTTVTNKLLLPSDLTIEEKMPTFSKWLTSLFQVIKDLEMFNIFSLIYPQKEGIPTYNPTGRYWVKLFHMGKYRKVEIDDRMPCTTYEEFLLPRCESIEELWPAILAKALIKLFSYRTSKMKYTKEKYANEVGDISFLYSLTGYIPEHLNLNFIKQDKFEYIVNLLNDTRFLNSQKYFICYNSYALESTNIKLNQKLYCSNGQTKSTSSFLNNKNAIDQPFLGINIYRNYLRRNTILKNKEKINDSQGENDISQSQGDFSINNIASNEITQTDPNNEAININTLGSDSNLNINHHKKSLTKKNSMKQNFSDSKSKSKSKNKPGRNSTKLLTVKEYDSPKSNSKYMNIRLSNNNVDNNYFGNNNNYNYNSNSLNLNSTVLSLKDEVKLNKLYPISFKDNILSLKLEKEKNERFIKNAIMGKEKMFKFSVGVLANLNLIESIQVSEKTRNIINQITKINSLYQLGEKYYKQQSSPVIDNNKALKNILSDCAYSITDIFFNGDEFNMERLKPVDFTDLKKKVLAAQTNFKLLTAQEKKNYISNIKELKLKHKDEKKQRLQELNEPGERLYLIKIKNSIKSALSSFLEKYTNEEISMAKKCLINNWRFPPPSYFERTFSKIELSNFKKIDGETSSDEMKYSNSIKLMNTSWTKEFYCNMIRNIHDEPSNLNISYINNKIFQEELEIYKNPKELVERQKGGVWVSWQEFLNIFKGFVIIHNSKSYRSIINIDNNWYNYKSDTYYNEKFVFFLTTNFNNLNANHPSHQAQIGNIIDKGADKSANAKDDKGKPQYQSLQNNVGNNISNNNTFSANQLNTIINSNNVVYAKYNTDLSFSQSFPPNTKFYNSLSNSCFLIVFEPNTTLNYLFYDSKYYIIFDLITTSGKKIFSNIRLSGYFATYQFDEIYFDQEYYLIVTGGVFPFGYNLRILSDHFVETLTHFNYIKKYYGLNQTNLTVSYHCSEKNKIFVFARVKIINKERSSYYISIKQNENNDNYLKKFYEVFIVNQTKERRLFLDKLDYLDASETPYYLIFTMTPPYNIPEGNLDIELLFSNKSIKVETVDLVEPYEIYDKYINNKHGIVMKEHLFVADLTNLSLEIELKKKSKILNNTNTGEKPDNTQQGLKNSFMSANTNSEFIKINDSIRLVVEIKKEDKIIYQKQFFTKTFIANIDLEQTLTNSVNAANISAAGDKERKDRTNKEISLANANIPFNFVLKLDTSECPAELRNEYENCETEFYWFIRVFSTDNLAFMKDTSKEEAEALLKQNWEASQPGRSERAKLSRKKYLLHVKKQRGEALTAEEEALLNEARNRIYLTTINQEQLQKKINAGNEASVANNNRKSAANNPKDQNTGKNITNPGNNKYDPLDNNYNQAQYLKQSFYARMNKTRVFPKPENHCSLFLKNFLSYVYRDRTIESNNNSQKFYLDENKLEELSKTVDERVLEYNNKRKKDELEFAEKKLIMAEETAQLKKKNIMLRKNFSSVLTDVLSAREKVSKDFKIINEKEKLLRDILNGETDLERSVQAYKETISQTNNISDKKFKSLIDDVFKYLSEKKDEIFKNEIKKFNGKDKLPITRCLEDYKANNWLLSPETIYKLNEISK